MSTIEHPHTPEHAMLREANHRIANHLALLASTVQIQASSVGKGPIMLSRDDVKRMMQEINSKIVSVGNLHRRLANTPGQDFDVADYLIETSVNLVSALGLTKKVHLSHKLDAHCRIAPDKAQALALFVSEVVTNAVKHAHPTGLPVQINFTCWNTADGGLTVEISDDGIGLPEGFDPELDGGVGFKLIRSLAEKMHGEMQVHSDELGLTFRLHIPLQRDTDLMAVAAD